jgi:hypothetical protein
MPTTKVNQVIGHGDVVEANTEIDRDLRSDIGN